MLSSLVGVAPRAFNLDSIIWMGELQADVASRAFHPRGAMNGTPMSIFCDYVTRRVRLPLKQRWVRVAHETCGTLLGYNGLRRCQYGYANESDHCPVHPHPY